MMDRVSLSGIDVYAHHGVHPAERELGQRFVIDVIKRVVHRLAELSLGQQITDPQVHPDRVRRLPQPLADPAKAHDPQRQLIQLRPNLAVQYLLNSLILSSAIDPKTHLIFTISE